MITFSICVINESKLAITHFLLVLFCHAPHPKAGADLTEQLSLQPGGRFGTWIMRQKALNARFRKLYKLKSSRIVGQEPKKGEKIVIFVQNMCVPLAPGVTYTVDNPC